VLAIRQNILLNVVRNVLYLLRLKFSMLKIILVEVNHFASIITHSFINVSLSLRLLRFVPLHESKIFGYTLKRKQISNSLCGWCFRLDVP
jgi:hypothetical protein